MHLVTFERREGRGIRDAAERGDDCLLGELAALGLDLGQSGSAGARRVGALLPPGPHAGDVVDLNRALAVLHTLEDVGAPEAQADSLLPADTHAFLRQIARALPAAQRALEFVAEASERYDAPDLVRAGVIVLRRGVRLAAPVPRPGKVLAVARNYAAHVAEAGGARPPEPVLFLKASSAVVGPEDEIVLPRYSQAVDYEGELAVVIGRVARHLTEESALDSVAGYTVANDVSARDYQNIRGQHFIGKSCDTFAPLGPALVTQDEIPDPHDLSIRTFLSGELVQSARTKEMIFPIARILAFASKLMTLEPGDVLLTGTPAGVGMARKPPRYLREGDIVDVEIERVGRLRSFVTMERG